MPISKLREFSSLRTLILQSDKELAAGTADFSPFLNLEQLHIENGRPKNLNSLRTLKNLKTFFCYREIGQGIETLGTLPQLENVTIHSNELTPKELAGLARSRSIECIDIRLAESVKDISKLATMRQLTSISISRKDASLQPLLLLPALEHLRIDRAAKNDQSVLAKLRSRGVKVEVVLPSS